MTSFLHRFRSTTWGADLQRSIKTEWDVAVVGGGFAGSIVACVLARKGYRVIVLERGKQIGRETRSGNLAGVEWWRTIGLKPPDFLVPVTRREALWLGSDYVVRKVHAPGPSDLVAFRREELDSFLTDAARQAGAEVVGDFGVEEVEAGYDWGACVRAADRIVTAKAVIIACGADEQVLQRSGYLKARRRGCVHFMCQQRVRLEHGSPTGDTAASVLTLANLPLPGFREALGWVLLLHGEAFVTISGAVSSRALADGEVEPRELLHALRVHPALEPILSSTGVVDWRTRVMGAVPPTRRVMHRDRVLLVGDAAWPLGGSVNPGGGFRWAAITAREAGSVLSRALDRPTRLFLRPYAERVSGIRSDSRWGFRRARLVHTVLDWIVGILTRFSP